GRVRLRGLARAPGQVLFAVRARDAAGAERSRVEAPTGRWTPAHAPPWPSSASASAAAAPAARCLHRSDSRRR
ncbi:hypothetical protein MOU_21295, partial [Xanthomonas citri pv. malvacearum str. GSPB1386]